MNDKHYIRSFFKVAGKIVGNTLTLAILASIISFFAFKNYFDFVLWVSAAVLFIMLPLLVASFFAVLIVDVNASEKKKNWQKTIVGGILALVGLVLARLAAIPCVGLGWNDSLTAKILNQVIIGFMAVSVIATLIELVGCGKNALRDKIEGTNLS